MESLTSFTPTQIINQPHDPKLIDKGRKIINSDLITDDGRKWLTKALDPFHDTQLRPVGYPDLDLSSSVVQEINLSMTLSKPAAAVTGTWDAHVFSLPDFSSPQHDPGFNALDPVRYNFKTGGYTGVAGTSIPMAGVVGLTGVSGSQWFPTLNTLQTAGIEAQNLQVGPNITDKCRVVGAAFEVINTTAPINQQGLVTAYRLPQLDSEVVLTTSTKDSASNDVFTPWNINQYAMPPVNVAEALILPASKQWHASRGCYSVILMNNLANPASGVSNKGRIYLQNNTVYSMVVGGDYNTGGIISHNVFIPGSSIPTLSGCMHSPYNTSGCILTGLSLETTLQVNVKYLIEVFPGPRSPFTTLAEASPTYDPEALRLYSQLVNHLPVGVPVDENPDGEWFETILGTLGSLAEMAGFLHPAFGLLGRGLKIASSVAPRVVGAIQGQRKLKKQVSKTDGKSKLKKKMK